MTIRQKLETRLVDHGLWDEEAAKVMNQAEQNDSLKDMKGRWNDDVENYPPQLLAVVWMSVKLQAKQWLEANAPKHFALAMFS